MLLLEEGELARLRGRVLVLAVMDCLNQYGYSASSLSDTADDTRRVVGRVVERAAALLVDVAMDREACWKGMPATG